MAITWVTAIDNAGRFVAAIGKRRYTRKLLQVGTPFVMSVPTAGMEELVVKIGGVHGDEDEEGGDKFSRLGIGKEECGDAGVPGVKNCCCYLICEVSRIDEGESDTDLVYAKIKHGLVKPEYWHKPKVKSDEASLFYGPPGGETLTFFGSGKFGRVVK